MGNSNHEDWVVVTAAIAERCAAGEESAKEGGQLHSCLYPHLSRTIPGHRSEPDLATENPVTLIRFAFSNFLEIWSICALQQLYALSEAGHVHDMVTGE